MLTALHPLLLWGATAVAVPILIHLLLRQRPRPRPWAAMRWLLAAAQAAQRRYRLTNLLLLLLRCLLIACVALAVARLSLAGFGGGDRLVLVVDRSASMGVRGTDPGPLAAAKAELARAELAYRTVAVVAVADKTEVLSEGGREDALAALARLEASDLPGGLDRASTAQAAATITRATGSGADVVLLSDFQQDDGAQLGALLAPRARALAHWAVGAPAANAMIGGVVSLGDLRPGLPGELLLRVLGAAKGAAIAADDGPFLPSGAALAPAAADGGALLRLTTPPLPAGEHLLRIRLEDDGLAYDNLLELPVTVRPAVPALAIQERIDYLGAALSADALALDCKLIRPAQFGAEPLPAQGVVALRTAIAEGARLRDWVRGGGVLWSSLDLLRDDPALRELVADVGGEDGKAQAGGEFRTGQADVDDILKVARRETAPLVALPAGAETVLRAGTAPLVVVLPAGRGWVVVELTSLAGVADRDFQNRGTVPLWVGRIARDYTARLHAPRFWTAGQNAPMAHTLKRGASAVACAAGEPVLLSPGAWKDEDGNAVVILPSPEEGHLQKSAPSGSASSFTAALPRRPGVDWGIYLAIAALALACGEGLLAAWAGKAYGR